MLIVYQSLNSGNQKPDSKDFNSSATDSRFTKMAHTRYAQQFHMRSNAPFQPLHSVEGLFPTSAPVTQGSFGQLVHRSPHSTPYASGITDNVNLVGRVIDHILRELQQYSPPDIIILGEVYLKNTRRDDYVVWMNYDNGLACQCFTVLIRSMTQTSHGLRITQSRSTPSYPILELSPYTASIRIALVHIPNKYIKDTTAVANFLADAKDNADIILGDTNLKSYNKLEEVGVKIWGETTSTFPIGTADQSSAHPGPQGVGTSSTEDSLYDRGISTLPMANFGEGMVDHQQGVMGPQPAYQFLGVLSKRIRVGQQAVTFSDHNGLAISIGEYSPLLRRGNRPLVPVNVPERTPLQLGRKLTIVGLVLFLCLLLKWLNNDLTQAEEKWLSALVGKSSYNFREELLQANTGWHRSKLATAIEAVLLPDVSSAVRGTTGTLTLISEGDHIIDHADNVAQLIAGIRSRAKGRNNLEVILLERTNDRSNLGMADVVLLASILRQADKAIEDIRVPDEIVNSPIYYDAVLFNVAHAHGAHVMGLDGDGGSDNLASPARDEARDKHMAKSIGDVLAKGYNVTAIIGAAHVNALRAHIASGS